MAKQGYSAYQQSQNQGQQQPQGGSQYNTQGGALNLVSLISSKATSVGSCSRCKGGAAEQAKRTCEDRRTLRR